MATRSKSSGTRPAARLDLLTYAPVIQFSSLAVGIDNLRYDVYLSPRFCELCRRYIRDLLRQASNLGDFYGLDAKAPKGPDKHTFRRHLTDLLLASLHRAQYEKKVELDLLLRLCLLKFILEQISAQFADLLLECKQQIRARGELFERSERAHVLRARLAELQAGRRNVFRQVGAHLQQLLQELEESQLAGTRRALFGDEYADKYGMFQNRLLFVEGGRDDQLFLDEYVLLGNFARDPDRFDTVDSVLVEFLKDTVLAGAEGEEVNAEWLKYEELSEQSLRTRAELSAMEEKIAALQQQLEHPDAFLSLFERRRDPAEARTEKTALEARCLESERTLAEFDAALDTAKSRAEFLTAQYHNRLGDFLNEPSNARRLFDPEAGGANSRSSGQSAQGVLLDEWIARLEERGLLPHVLASYELRNVYVDLCPPVHLQQVKRALVDREELKRVQEILSQFPARRYSLDRVREVARKIRRYPQEHVRVLAVRFAEDVMRLRRDLRNYRHLTGLMERIHLVQEERTRELSRMNHTLCEFLLTDESKPAEDRVISHVVIKADVRGSTHITQELIAQGLNPATYFSMNLYEPVKRILERYGAAKVFIEGDAIILAIYETETNRAQQRAVAKACLLACELLGIVRVHNAREKVGNLPRIELGVGIAFQNSAPTYWMDSDSKIMISRALNLSDRLSSCSKVALRMLSGLESPFGVFLFQTVVEEGLEEDVEEFVIRYNLNGIEINEEGFAKLAEEIALQKVELDAPMPWGRDRVNYYFGEVPIGDSLEMLVVRRGTARKFLPGRKIGGEGTHVFFEVCCAPEVVSRVAAEAQKARVATPRTQPADVA